ncbi:MAG: alpha/beta hydrolase, partial [Woeseiaceae bacterium]
MNRARRKILLTVAVLPIAIVGALIADLYFSQEDMIFPGKKLSPDFQFSFDVPFQEMMIPVDGAEINGLHF